MMQVDQIGQIIMSAPCLISCQLFINFYANWHFVKDIFQRKYSAPLIQAIDVGCGYSKNNLCIFQTSQELRTLSRSLSDCQSLTLDVMIQVSLIC